MSNKPDNQHYDTHTPLLDHPRPLTRRSLLSTLLALRLANHGRCRHATFHHHRTATVPHAHFVKVRHEITFLNPLVIQAKPPSAELLARIKLIQKRLDTMPTNEDLSAKLTELETVLTQEIQEITDALAASGVSQENLDRLTAFKDRIAGIVNPNPTEPPPTA